MIETLASLSLPLVVLGIVIASALLFGIAVHGAPERPDLEPEPERDEFDDLMKLEWPLGQTRVGYDQTNDARAVGAAGRPDTRR